jgi:hypothetical protein
MAETARMADVDKDIENPLITQINHESFTRRPSPP